ncbi:MAG TPA: hypothetical protein VNO26_00220 [Candidatus Limnocylindria bacterium]|nr:hypothetical protein [Candidatus Limnocylindria bacterium]
MQRVLIRRRTRPWRRLAPAWRWTLAAFVAMALYRSVPTEPDPALRTTVAQYLGFEYTRARAPEMEARAAERATDALLAVTDDVLNARVEIDSIAVRGPILPAPLPRNAVVHVRYRVLKGRDLLEANERYLAFGKSFTSDWHFVGERGPILYWILPS